MTNEEKARKIVWDLFDDGLFYHKYASQRQEIQSAIIKMAEWKDGQKEAEKEALIDKACEWLRNNMYEGTCEQMLSKKPYPFMSDFIEEFKQAMKGGSNE